ncbi:MAG: hypothetical protein EU529_09610 [Promethearchaeota archaeon]|nr:MAG: hypothetical protein EU529_09610 [Candidatus Lokiarchaeota archaeon]
MMFFEILDKLKRKSASLIIYCLLDRIPIIVFGDNSDEIDDFLMELSNLIHFRREYVFNTDFISIEDYNNLIETEDMDYNAERVHIRCSSNVALKALNQFNEINSWMIGVVAPKHNENLEEIKNLIKEKSKVYLSILLSADTISVELEGTYSKLIDLSLEENILRKISEDTEKSIVKMKRVLSERTKSDKLSKEIIKTLLDFETEKNELIKNIFKKEIQNFYSGSKRAFFILSRLRLLTTMEIETKIGNKTLFETIDYDEATINRILSFINREWKEDFSDLIESGKKVDIGDKIQSLWG